MDGGGVCCDWINYYHDTIRSAHILKERIEAVSELC